VINTVVFILIKHREPLYFSFYIERRGYAGIVQENGPLTLKALLSREYVGMALTCLHGYTRTLLIPSSPHPPHHHNHNLQKAQQVRTAEK
jgi:hypothetical protein